MHNILENIRTNFQFTKLDILTILVDDGDKYNNI